MSPSMVSASALKAELAQGNAPLVIDVRRRQAFVEAEEMLAGALRREPEHASAWAKSLPKASRVVVYCVHGREASQTTAAALNDAGIAARYLEGGLEAWKTAGGALAHKPRSATTRWVTRERPKIDRIARPWLV